MPNPQKRQYVYQKILIAAISARMKALSMSQVELARQAGVARSQLVEFLGNKKQFGSEAMGKIFQVLRLNFNKSTTRITRARAETILKRVGAKEHEVQDLMRLLGSEKFNRHSMASADTIADRLGIDAKPTNSEDPN